MKIYTEIAGNINDPEWARRAREAEVEYLELDQWTAQKSRMVIEGANGNRYAVALERIALQRHGDVVEYDPERGRMAVVRIRLSEVMVADLSSLEGAPWQTVIRVALELGHALGNQHWPAVVKGTRIYVPLTVDRKVMESVMRTHRFEGVDYSFRAGSEVIPYLAPHEVRRLFGGTGPDSQVHHHHHHHALQE